MFGSLAFRRAIVLAVRCVRLLAVLMLASGCWACSAVRTPEPSPVPCSRVTLESSPPWTAAAVWNRDETEMLLVDPGSRSLAVYGRDGRRLREVAPPEVAELDFSVPMRLERHAGGYVLIDKTRILSFDDALSLLRRDEPFAAVAAHGVVDGSFNDVLVDGKTLYGYADFVDTRRAPVDDPAAAGTWRRGFVRLEPRRGELDFLHELALDDGGEYAAYYVYDRRPYVAELDGTVYVLRFSEPWSVYRVRRRALRQVVRSVGNGEVAWALHGWNGRLYVLTSRLAPRVDDGDEEPTEAILERVEERARAELVQALLASSVGRKHWTLHEIDPRSGRQRRLRLPSAAEKIRLVPGRAFWTAVEESTAPNLGLGASGTSFLFLPASEILAGSFRCAASTTAE